MSLRGGARVARMVGIGACGFPGRRMRRPYGGAPRYRQPEINGSSDVPNKGPGDPPVFVNERLQVDTQKLAATHSPHAGNHQVRHT